MTDENDKKAGTGKGAEDALGDVMRRLGGVFGQAAELVDVAKKLGDREGKPPTTDAQVSMRTLDGTPLSFSSLQDAFAEAIDQTDKDTGPQRPLRQAEIEFVIDTPERLVAIADMPAICTDDVEITIDGDSLAMQAASNSAEYWAEVLLPRDVTKAKMDVAVVNGILNIVWRFPGEDG